MERRYNAFLSYSHSDAEVATKFAHSIEQFGRGPFQAKRVRVFRDVSELAPSVSLAGEIQAALRQSQHLILLASPESAQPSWVGVELGQWIEASNVESLIIVLIRGEIAWDKTTGDFDWELTTALPVSLRGRFHSEPLYVDLRSDDPGGRLTPTHPGFRDAVTMVAAQLNGVSREEIESDQARLPTFRRAFGSIAIGVVMSVTASLILALLGVLQTPDNPVAPPQARERQVDLRLLEPGEKPHAWDLTAVLPDTLPFNRGITLHLEVARADRSRQAKDEATLAISDPPARRICVEAFSSSLTLSRASNVPCERSLPEHGGNQAWYWAALPNANVVGKQDVGFAVRLFALGQTSDPQIFSLTSTLLIEKGVLDRYPAIAAAFLGAIAVVGGAATTLLGQRYFRREQE